MIFLIHFIIKISKIKFYKAAIKAAANNNEIEIIYFLLSNEEKISDILFYGIEELTAIAIPYSVESIEYSSFRECKSLARIIIPSSVKSIGQSAFNGCSSLIEINIPSSVKSIGDCAFFYCESLRITIPSSFKANTKSFINYTKSITYY